MAEQNRRERFQICRTISGARRVRGRVQNQPPRLSRNRRFELLGRELKPARHIARHDDGFTPA